ncbi:MAG TPA: glycosyl hydrolase family 18 protein [Cytophagaceae bacterium]
MKRLLRKCLLLVLPLVLAISANAQKVAGYFPSYRSGYINSVQWDKLTDCYFAFINADVDGNLIEGDSWDAVFGFDMTTFLNVKSKCQQNNVRYHISVGGADGAYQRAARLKDIARNVTARNNFAQKIVQFAIYHDLDGINIDWEFPNEVNNGIGGNTTDHKNLIQAVRDAINASSKPSLTLGIAVGGEYSGSINHTQYLDVLGVVSLIDEFHIMAYDFPSSYDANNHASKNDAEQSLEVWSLKGIPYSKLMLGVPFYGRKANRNEDGGEYNVFTQYLSGTDLQNAYNNDSYNEYYYNGKATLEWKTDLIMNKGGMGIFVWDLGQDRSDEYSLLSVLKNRMDIACTTPQPNLGPDVGFCTGSVTLNSDVSTAAGRTFTWKKDGTVIINESLTATTYNATQGGTYTVIVKQGTCQRSDEIKVVEGSSLTATGGSRCGAGEVTLTVNNTGGTYDWYDVATGGAKLHTGKTYTPNVTSTKDFYVQDRGTLETYTLGKTSLDNVWAEEMSKYAQKIHVHQELTLNSVRIWSTNTVTFRIQIFRYDGQNILMETNDTTITSASAYPGTSHVININKVLAPGSYYVMAKHVSGDNSIYYDINQPSEKYNIPGVITLVDSAYLDDTPPYNFNDPTAPREAYGTFFEWKVSTGVAPACGRTKVTATVNPGPNQSLSVSPGSETICEGADGSIVIANSQANVTYQLYKDGVPVGNSVAGTGSNLTIPVSSTNLSPGNNVFTVKASSVGCTDVALTDDATIEVIAKSTPVITFNNVTKVYGDPTFSMTATSLPAGTFTYSLESSIPSGIVSVASNGQVTINGAGTATIKADLTVSGCYNATSQTAVLTINKATPTLSITSTNAGTVGTSINLTHSSNSNGAVTYSITSGASNANLSGTTLNLTAAGAVTIQASQAETDNYNAATATQTITISSKPTPTITLNDETKTYGDAPFTLNATSNSSGTKTYSLVNSTPSNIITVDANGQVTINGAGTATVKVEQAEDATYGAGSATATITILKANRSVVITSENTGLKGTTITLTYDLSEGTGAVTWSVTNGTGQATLAGNTLSLVEAGTVTVTVEVAADNNYNAVSESMEITIDAATATAMPNGTNGLSIAAYPNPFTDNSTIVVTMSKAAHLNLTISDALGTQKHVLVNEVTGMGEHSFTTPVLSSGVYVIQMIVDDVILTERIVKVD